MALPKYPISKIPSEGAPALPQTWNGTYGELDQNLSNLDGRLVARESEINTARGGHPSLGGRISAMAADIQGLDPDMMNAIVAGVLEASASAGLANREGEKTRTRRIQSGVMTIINRGIVSGCTVSRSSTATRNINLAAGVAFGNGRLIPMPEEQNGASVPGNPGGSPQVCYLYLGASGGGHEMYCTELGEEVPDGGIPLYRVTVPAGNTEITDRYLASVSLTDIRRVESGAPCVYASAPFIYVPLGTSMLSTDYSVHLDILGFEGGGHQLGYVYADDKQHNGFKLCLNGSADSVRVRWTAMRMDL